MKTKLKTMFSALLMIAVLFTNCKKEPGPKGDTGATGPQGQAGPSAKYYDITKVFSSITTTGSFSLPNALASGDVVLVYAVDTYGFKYVLPYKGSLTTATSTTDNFDLTYSFGSITVFFENKTPLTNVHALNLKVVVISATQTTLHPDVNLNDYSEVARTFNIKD